MQQRKFFILALLVLIIPFLGLPGSWKTTLLVVVSLSIVYIAYSNEIKVFFTPKLHHDSVASEAFSRQQVPNDQPSSNA